MRETAERRVKMLEFLCERWKTKVCELAAEFGVSRRTVHNDLSVLSCFTRLPSNAGQTEVSVLRTAFVLGESISRIPNSSYLKRYPRR